MPSFYNPFKANTSAESLGGHTPSKRILTPPTGLTAARPVLAAKAATMLVQGDRYVTPVVAAMAASDMEGTLARWIDRRWPDSGLGSSSFGIVADKYADVFSLLLVSGATLRAPNVSPMGKLATAAILGEQGVKTAVALSWGYEYKRATGDNLDLPASDQGKRGMAEQFTGLALAVLTNDLDPGYARTAAGIGAIGLAGLGVHDSRQARSQYSQQFEELMADVERAEHDTAKDSAL